MNYDTNHTFIICSYKDCEYLEDCIKSLINQSHKSNVILTTSTPSSKTIELCKKYNINYIINKIAKGAQSDWNFALSVAKTDYVTLCHQDDIYGNDYFYEINKFIKKDKKNIISFIHTGYYNIDENGKRYVAVGNRIKRFMLFTAQFKIFQFAKIFKKSYLKFGDPITCPSITYNVKKLGTNIFNSPLKWDCDWDVYYKIANKKGRIVYISKKLIFNRTCSNQRTETCINNGERAIEDKIMFESIWPKFIARILCYFYKKSHHVR